MKRTVIILAAVATMLFGACKSTKVTPQELGNKRLTSPCFNEAKDSKEYFAGRGVDENVNRQSAHQDALTAARQIVKEKVGVQLKGISTDYDRYVRGDARQSTAQAIVEGETTMVLDYLLDHSEEVCMEEYMTPSGTYEVFVAIRISKSELADKTSDKLSENEELKALFNRDQFRKWLDEYKKEMKGE